MAGWRFTKSVQQVSLENDSVALKSVCTFTNKQKINSIMYSRRLLILIILTPLFGDKRMCCMSLIKEPSSTNDLVPASHLLCCNLMFLITRMRLCLTLLTEEQQNISNYHLFGCLSDADSNCATSLSFQQYSPAALLFFFNFCENASWVPEL